MRCWRPPGATPPGRTGTRGGSRTWTRPSARRTPRGRARAAPSSPWAHRAGRGAGSSRGAPRAGSPRWTRRRTARGTRRARRGVGTARPRLARRGGRGRRRGGRTGSIRPTSTAAAGTGGPVGDRRASRRRPRGAVDAGDGRPRRRPRRASARGPPRGPASPATRGSGSRCRARPRAVVWRAPRGPARARPPRRSAGRTASPVACPSRGRQVPRPPCPGGTPTPLGGATAPGGSSRRPRARSTREATTMRAIADGDHEEGPSPAEPSQQDGDAERREEHRAAQEEVQDGQIVDPAAGEQERVDAARCEREAGRRRERGRGGGGHHPSLPGQQSQQPVHGSLS